MKPSNFSGAPRTQRDATFADWGAALERPVRRRTRGWALAIWAVSVLAALTLLASMRGGV
jgi:hypothetical protein